MWLLQAYTVKINLLFEEHKDKTFEVKEATLNAREVKRKSSRSHEEGGGH